MEILYTCGQENKADRSNFVVFLRHFCDVQTLPAVICIIHSSFFSFDLLTLLMLIFYLAQLIFIASCIRRCILLDCTATKII